LGNHKYANGHQNEAEWPNKWQANQAYDEHQNAEGTHLTHPLVHLFKNSDLRSS
jgi:hypothetical protein